MIGDDMILLFRGPVADQMLIGTSGRVLVGNGKPMVTNHYLGVTVLKQASTSERISKGRTVSATHRLVRSFAR
jgi:hypothetical protein